MLINDTKKMLHIKSFSSASLKGPTFLLTTLLSYFSGSCQTPPLRTALGRNDHSNARVSPQTIYTVLCRMFSVYITGATSAQNVFRKVKKAEVSAILCLRVYLERQCSLFSLQSVIATWTSNGNAVYTCCCFWWRMKTDI